MVIRNGMNSKKVFQNAKWIVACKIIQSLLNLVVGMLMARYLGPSNYGLLNYAASVVGFVVPIMQLGMRSTLVHEYISRPEENGAVLGTSLAMSLISSAACMASVIGFTSLTNPGEIETLLVVALYSLSLPFQAIEMVQYWFQAKLLSKYPSVAMLGAYLVTSVYKIWLLGSGKNVAWFAVSHAIEYLLVGILLLIIYRRRGNKKLSFSMPLAKELFNRSKYYIVSALMVSIFGNTDHIMLKLMIGDAENGLYSAAFTCAGVANFMYAAIIDSVRPVILESKEKNTSAFENNLSGLYCVITYIALAQSLFFTFFAKQIIMILFGQEYLKSVPVLQILIWYIAFSYMGTIRNVWILAEKRQSSLWIINLSGALINILLNVIMIPLWGACGAAFASVLTQFFANFVIGFLLGSIRDNNRLMIKGLNPKMIVQIISDLKTECDK